MGQCDLGGLRAFLEKQLQAKCVVLVKNENNLLPLMKGCKVYVDSTSLDTKVYRFFAQIISHRTVV